jgi:hypothetical protein
VDYGLRGLAPIRVWPSTTTPPAHRRFQRPHRRVREQENDSTSTDVRIRPTMRPTRSRDFRQACGKATPDDHHHAPQGELPATERSASKRQGPLDRALERSRHLSDDHERARGSSGPHRAARAQPDMVPGSRATGRALSV